MHLTTVGSFGYKKYLIFIAMAKMTMYNQPYKVSSSSHNLDPIPNQADSYMKNFVPYHPTYRNLTPRHK